MMDPNSTDSETDSYNVSRGDAEAQRTGNW